METIDLKDIEPIKLDDIQKVEQPSKLESSLRGAAQGATLGFSDEIVGALESGAGSLGLVPDKTYEQARDEARAANKRAQEANSGYYTGGEVAGGLAAAFVPGGAAATIGKAARTGAILGGFSGAGSSEATGWDAALDAGKGALGGFLVGGGVGYIGKGLSKAAQAYKDSALRKLVQSGVNIDDPVVAQRIADETSRGLSEKFASAPGKLAKQRDAIVDQAAFDEMRFSSPKVDSDLISSIEKSFSDSPHTLSILDDIKSIIKKPSISPEDYRKLNTKLDRLRSTRDGEPLNNNEINELVRSTKKEISENLPQEWKEANKLYSRYLSDVVEPSFLKGGKFSRTGAERTEAKAQDVLTELLEEVGKGNKEALYKLEQLKSGLQTFDKRTPGLIKETSGLDAETLGKEITEGAKSIKALGEYQTPLKAPGLSEGLSTLSGHPGLALGKFALRNKAGTKALGGIAKLEKSTQDLVSSGMAKLRTASDSELFELAERLMSNEKTKTIGSFLQNAVQNKDLVKRNAAIFSTLQNPQARLMVMPAKQEE